MTDTKATSTAASSSRAPTHVAYKVRDGNDDSFWTRIGAAWPHKDGKGFNIQLDSVPLDGRITLREAGEQQK